MRGTTEFAARLQCPERLLPTAYPPQDWNVMLWLNRWDQDRRFQENDLPSIGKPQPPLTMYELFEYHRAIGMLDYFFAEICPDRAALSLG
jgi:hypothetical protein